MSDFLAKVTAQLDLQKANAAMDAFLKERELKVNVDLDMGRLNINSILNQIVNQFHNAGNLVGRELSQNINTAIGNINVTNSRNQIDGLQRALKGLNFNDGAINNVTRELSNMDVAITKITQHVNGNHLTVQVEGIDSLGRAVTEIKGFNTETGNLTRTSKTISESFKQMFSSVDVSKLNSDISALDANFVKLKGSINNESTELQGLRTALNNISQIEGLNRQQAEFDRITQRVRELSIAYKTAKADATAVAASQQLLAGRNILGNQIEAWMNRNTKAAKIYEDELKALINQLNSVGNAAQLKNVAQQFAEIKSEAAAAGNLGRSVFGQLFANMTKLSPLFGMGTAISSSIRTVKGMVRDVYELDTALVDLKKTTTMSNADLESFYSNSSSIAKEMGVTTAEIINQASAWSRLGYSSKDAAEAMSKLSSQFAAISPGMNVEKATDGLVSIMKAFGVEVADVEDGIMSKINIIGNTAATSNSDIVEMLTRSSSAMSEANNSLEETIALETAAKFLG